MLEQLKVLEEKVQIILGQVSKLKKENEMLSSKNSVLQTKLNEQGQVLDDVLKENAQLKQKTEEVKKEFEGKDVIEKKIEEMLKSIEETEK